MPNFPYGRTVTLIHRTVSGQDERGNDTYAESSQAIFPAVVQPSGSNEFTQFTDQVTTDIVAYLPFGTEVSPLDAVEIDGVRYEVQGDISSWVSPFSGNTSPIQVRLNRVTGVSV